MFNEQLECATVLWRDPLFPVSAVVPLLPLCRRKILTIGFLGQEGDDSQEPRVETQQHLTMRLLRATKRIDVLFLTSGPENYTPQPHLFL